MSLNIKILLLTLVYFVCAPVFCMIYDYGDFSSRSYIERQLFNEKYNIPQEIKDLISVKKLDLSVKCLVEQINKENFDNVNILLKAKLNPNQIYELKYPVYYAVEKNNLDIVKLLVENNAQLDRGIDSELFLAVKNKNSDLALYLLEHGARINYYSPLKNNSILYFALKNNMIEVVEQLANRKVMLDAKSYKLIINKNLQQLFDY